MPNSRSAFILILAAAFCPPGSAQVFEGRLTNTRISSVPQLVVGALGAQSSAGLPQITSDLGATLAPSLSASALATPQVSLQLSPLPVLSQTTPAAAPVLPPAVLQTAAPSMKISAVADAVTPALQTLQAPDLKGEDAASAAERVMSPVLGQTRESLPLAVSEPTPAPLAPVPALLTKSRGGPLLKQVSFSEEISAQHQSLFQETLTRRKAGWTRQLAAMGVKLEGPVAPVVTVRSAKDIAKGTKVEFTADWNQGEMHVGAFKAIVTLKNVDPELRRLPAPEPAKERQLRLRFKKTILAKVGGIDMESQVTDPDIASYLESKGLRLLSKGWDGYYTVAVTGRDQADAVARGISGTGIVLYATPLTFTVPEANQIQIVFKKSTVRSFGGLNVETSVDETKIGTLLRDKGLRVLSIDRDGIYTVGAEGLRSESVV